VAKGPIDAMDLASATALEIPRFDLIRTSERAALSLPAAPATKNARVQFRTALRETGTLMTAAMTKIQIGEAIQANGLAWTGEGVTIPHGSDAKMSYMRGQQNFFGWFLNGKLVVDGRQFDTLSQAASALARNRRGRAPNLNGWAYWHVRFPGSEDWIPMAALKTAAEQQHGDE
jgi:hypothetical protein